MYVCDGKGGVGVMVKPRFEYPKGFNREVFNMFPTGALFITHLRPKIFNIEDLYDQM